jgi:hypothetical protein
MNANVRESFFIICRSVDYSYIRKRSCTTIVPDPAEARQRHG